MNKILDSSYCHCGCNDNFPPDTLRITAGNDFSVVIQLTVKEDDEWVRYDMTDARDIELNIVSPNKNRIETPCTVDENGNLNAVIDAQQFKSQLLYGIEVIWTGEDELDKRAYASDVFVFVNDSRDATENGYEYTSDNPYEYNLKFNGDLAVLSIGRIPDVDMTDYYTKNECDERFIDTDEFIDTLNNYVRTDELDNFVTFTELDTMSYVTAQQLDGMGYLTNNDLNDYPTFSDIDNMGYLTNDDLSDYPTFNDIDSMGYITSGDLSDYPTFSDIDNMGYLTNTDLNGYATEQYVNDAVAGVTVDLTDYPTFSDIDGMGYLTNTDLNGYATFSDIDSMSYVTSSDLSDYATFSDIDAMSYTTYAYLDNVLQSIPTFNPTDYYNKIDIDTMLNSYITCDEIDNYNQATATALTYHELAIRTNHDNFSNYYDKTQSDARYVTSSQVSNNYVDFPSLENVTYTTAGALCDLDSRVTTLEQGGGGTIPSNVVTCDDATYIYMLSQSDYDTLEQNQQLDSDTFYYITDATSNYVSFSDIDSMSYVTNTDLQQAISGVTIDESKIVHINNAETISGAKTFSASNRFTNETKFENNSGAGHLGNFVWIDSGVYKSSLFTRAEMDQLIVAQIILPQVTTSNSSSSFSSVQDTLTFSRITAIPDASRPTLEQLAKIDTSGIYEGNTLLANKYTQSSTIRTILQISQNDYDTLVNNQQTDANTLYIIV